MRVYFFCVGFSCALRRNSACYLNSESKKKTIYICTVSNVLNISVCFLRSDEMACCSTRVVRMRGLIITDITSSSLICDSGVRRVKTVFIAISNNRTGNFKHNSISMAFVSSRAVEIVQILLDLSCFFQWFQLLLFFGRPVLLLS